MTAASLNELLNLGGTLGTIAVLVWFCRRFLERWEKSQAELITALQGVVKENNELLAQVRERLAGDTSRWQKTTILPNHNRVRTQQTAAHE